VEFESFELHLETRPFNFKPGQTIIHGDHPATCAGHLPSSSTTSQSTARPAAKSSRALNPPSPRCGVLTDGEGDGSRKTNLFFLSRAPSRRFGREPFAQVEHPFEFECPIPPDLGQCVCAPHVESLNSFRAINPPSGPEYTAMRALRARFREPGDDIAPRFRTFS